MYKFNLMLKRLFDLLVSALAVVVLIPFWIGISVAVKRDSEGPVLFKQERRTVDGKIFLMWKFRSMIPEAEKMGTGLFNYENDPRVTKVGRKLRDTSLDELPQLFNILKGDMSLVGPRPCVKDELGEFKTLNRKYKKRFAMKAGLTGLAQVNGRNDISWEKKVEFDDLYIDKFKNMGLLIDIQILIKSVVKVLKKEDIYEDKLDGDMDSREAAKAAEREIIRIAHLPDEDGSF